MKKHYVDLWGKNFLYLGEKDYTPHPRYFTIFEAYGRPSDRKIAIWESWCEWARIVEKDGHQVNIGIVSRNTNFFTIEGTILTDGGELYGFHITATRQEYWSIW